MKISVIVPILNEKAQLEPLLKELSCWQKQGSEVVVVDGGSTDGTRDALHASGYRLIDSPPGRATQMNAGARASSGDILLFLHADTQLPANAPAEIAGVLSPEQPGWGFFQVAITGQSPWLSMVSWWMNQRSRITGIATGDQALFVSRRWFDQVGGYPNQPLMEDIEICKRLNAIGRPHCLSGPVATSGRRWEKHGIWRTIFLMWRLRFAYWRGVSAHQLAAAYRQVR